MSKHDDRAAVLLGIFIPGVIVEGLSSVIFLSSDFYCGDGLLIAAGDVVVVSSEVVIVFLLMMRWLLL